MAKAWKEEQDLGALQLHGKRQTQEGFARGRNVVTLTTLLICAEDLGCGDGAGRGTVTLPPSVAKSSN